MKTLQRPTVRTALMLAAIFGCLAAGPASAQRRGARKFTNSRQLEIKKGLKDLRNANRPKITPADLKHKSSGASVLKPLDKPEAVKVAPNVLPNLGNRKLVPDAKVVPPAKIVPPIIIGKLSGKWNSNLGPVTLTQFGNRVSGTLQFMGKRPVSISGHVLGRVVRYTYAGQVLSGTGTWVISKDDKRLTGYYRTAASRNKHASVLWR
ncbi:MAG: hypothetical protein ISR77_04000 [Pirellulaceae bacterium]|nr:hypothetical protein [Pirellulaceae bacterium]